MPGTESSRARSILGEATAVVAATAVVVASFVLAEGWIVATVVVMGPLAAFSAISCTSWLLSSVIAYAYSSREGRRGPGRLVTSFRRWIEVKHEIVEQKSAALARMSDALALVILSVTVGPFLTAIAIRIRGYAGVTAYALCGASSVIFSIVWVAVYSGGLAALRVLLSR